MTVVHLSYYPDKEFNTPGDWLQKVRFFNGILEALAKKITVHDVKVINYNGIVQCNGVTHHFLKSSNIFRLNKYIKKLNPDVVIVAGILFPVHVILLRYQLKTSTKIIVQHHAEKPFVGLKALFQKISDKYVNNYFFSAKELANKWIEKKLVTPEKVSEIMEASSFFKPMDKHVAKAHTKVESANAYLWVGKFNDNKDPFTAIKAFSVFIKQNADAKLYMIFNENNLPAELNDLVKANHSKNNIQLIQKVKHEEMLYWYNSVNFIISTSHYEGSGVAVCEAMSCGCIPVLTNIPSFKMMSNNGSCGFLFEAGNVQSLLNALEKTSQTDVLLKGAEALNYFNNRFSFDAIAEEMMDVFSIL